MFLPRYTRVGASSRVRTYQYLPLWEDHGYQVKVAPFFNDKYLKEVYARRPIGKWNVFLCYLKRFFILFTVWRYDWVWVEKEVFPYFPAYAEWLLSKWRGYIIDYDDAVFHNYDYSRFAILKWLMKNKIDRVMRYADLVWVGSPYLEERALRAGAARIERLPTVIDPSRYRQKVHITAIPYVTIGWIGSPNTSRYLDGIINALERLHQAYRIKFLMVNGEKKLSFTGCMEMVPWSEEGEVDALLQMDIGIMPLPNSPWERGKCGYKLIQYMGCGLPVVATPIGINKDIVHHGVNGYLAYSENEWVNYLGKLVVDAKTRQDMGKKGYELVQQCYTLQKNFMKITEVMTNQDIAAQRIFQRN